MSSIARIYVCNINTNQWSQTPLSGYYICSIPHIIGDKLTIIGGQLSATDNRTSKVSNFDDGKQSSISYYPDLFSVGSLPGVVSHEEYVIVAGGRSLDGNAVQDDIEVLNWMENSHWRKVSIKLHMPNACP